MNSTYIRMHIATIKEKNCSCLPCCISHSWWVPHLYVSWCGTSVSENKRT